MAKERPKPTPEALHCDLELLIPHLNSEAIAILRQAQQEALALGQNRIGAEHILLAIINGNGTASDFLKEKGVNIEDAHKCLEILTTERTENPTKPLKPTPSVLKTLNLAIVRAKDYKKVQADPALILYALSKSGNGKVYAILDYCGTLNTAISISIQRILHHKTISFTL